MSQPSPEKLRKAGQASEEATPDPGVLGTSDSQCLLPYITQAKALPQHPQERNLPTQSSPAPQPDPAKAVVPSVAGGGAIAQMSCQLHLVTGTS